MRKTKLLTLALALTAVAAVLMAPDYAGVGPPSSYVPGLKGTHGTESTIQWLFEMTNFPVGPMKRTFYFADATGGTPGWAGGSPSDSNTCTSPEDACLTLNLMTKLLDESCGTMIYVAGGSDYDTLAEFGPGAGNRGPVTLNADCLSEYDTAGVIRSHDDSLWTIDTTANDFDNTPNAVWPMSTGSGFYVVEDYKCIADDTYDCWRPGGGAEGILINHQCAHSSATSAVQCISGHDSSNTFVVGPLHVNHSGASTAETVGWAPGGSAGFTTTGAIISRGTIVRSGVPDATAKALSFQEGFINVVGPTIRVNASDCSAAGDYVTVVGLHNNGLGGTHCTDGSDCKAKLRLYKTTIDMAACPSFSEFYGINIDSFNPADAYDGTTIDVIARQVTFTGVGTAFRVDADGVSSVGNCTGGCFFNGNFSFRGVLMDTISGVFFEWAQVDAFLAAGGSLNLDFPPSVFVDDDESDPFGNWRGTTDNTLSGHITDVTGDGDSELTITAYAPTDGDGASDQNPFLGGGCDEQKSGLCADGFSEPYTVSLLDSDLGIGKCFPVPISGDRICFLEGGGTNYNAGAR